MCAALTFEQDRVQLHGRTDSACLLQGGRKGHAALLRSEAQLELLMRMASAGSAPQHQAAAQRLVATNAIARISQVCRGEGFDRSVRDCKAVFGRSI